jgi:ADP-ribose pyrophosphatase
MPENTRQIFKGRIVELNIEEHRLPDGRTLDFEMVRHPGGAAILPLLPDGRVLLIRQFRPAAGGMLLEIPAGKLEPGEPPEECVRREIEEEAGYRAGRIEPLGHMLTAPGFCDEVIHLFVARDLSPVESRPEPDEYIEVAPLPADEALDMALSGRIPDGKTQLALLLARGKGLI